MSKSREKSSEELTGQPSLLNVTCLKLGARAASGRGSETLSRDGLLFVKRSDSVIPLFQQAM